jgi:hypothetical protein
MNIDGEIVVPALALRTPDGAGLDVDATARYAQRAAATWADAFILSGSTTHGDLLTVNERTDLLGLWLRFVPALRLVACCWHQEDVLEATLRGITPMVVMHSLPNPDLAARWAPRPGSGRRNVRLSRDS